MRRLASCLLAVSLASSAGCASIFPPKERLIRVTSFPDKATVRLDGEIVGVTPCFVSVSHQAPGLLAFEMEGHETLELAIAQMGNAKIWLNLLWMTAFFPLAIIVHAADTDETWRDDLAISGGVTAGWTLASFIVDSSTENSTTHSTAPIHVTLRKREGR